MKILLTGGAGYVGSACLRHLLRHGVDAHAYDDLSRGHRGAVPSDRLVVGDILDTPRLANVLRDGRFDAVMHFAALAYVGESVSEPERYWRINVSGSVSLLDAMVASGVRRILFSSTCSTYGDSPTVPMSEASPQTPCNPYARTKLAIEWAIRDYADAHGFGFTLLRYFNASGADEDGAHGEDHEPESHLIPLVLQVVSGRRTEIGVFGTDYPTPDGTCIRDYIHVDDLAQAHRLAIEATSPGSRHVFNVGTGHGHSVLEVIEMCEQVTGRKVARRLEARRPGDPPALVADSSKLVRELGWSPRFADLRRIVETAWRWHDSNPKGYGDRR
jgi:UDP-glucose 4-epimerase